MSEPHPHFERIAIIGVGLIGGSIALAAKARGLTSHVIGHGRSADRLQLAQKLGIIDSYATHLSLIKNADLIVVCTPVDRIAVDVMMLLALTNNESTLITDVGSVKDNIVREVQNIADHERYIGSHPLAGSHHTGFEYADVNLFENRVCVLTPTEVNSSTHIETIRGFWSALGMNVRSMTSVDHDQTLSRTSHIPHLVAAATALLVDETAIDLASSGYRDTTRVAVGDPDLWTAIFNENASHLMDSTDQLIKTLTQFKKAISNKDSATLKKMLEQAQRLRKLYHEETPQS